MTRWKAPRLRRVRCWTARRRCCSKLGHPNIVKVLDYFVEQGRNYLLLDISTDRICGSSSDKRTAKREHSDRLGFADGDELEIFARTRSAADPSRFTPDNLVLCEDGAIVVIDFGAANGIIGNSTGTFVGKHAFIAPEQFRGKAVVQSDIYAFGCTLHFLLTGKEPEAAEHLQSSR